MHFLSIDKHLSTLRPAFQNLSYSLHLGQTATHTSKTHWNHCLKISLLDHQTDTFWTFTVEVQIICHINHYHIIERCHCTAECIWSKNDLATHQLASDRLMMNDESLLDYINPFLPPPTSTSLSSLNTLDGHGWIRIMLTSKSSLHH